MRKNKESLPYDIMEAIGKLPDSMIKEAEDYTNSSDNKKRRMYRMIRPVAAMAASIAIVVFLVNTSGGLKMGRSAPDGAMKDAAIEDNKEISGSMGSEARQYGYDKNGEQSAIDESVPDDDRYAQCEKVLEDIDLDNDTMEVAGNISGIDGNVITITIKSASPTTSYNEGDNYNFIILNNTILQDSDGISHFTHACHCLYLRQCTRHRQARRPCRECR